MYSTIQLLQTYIQNKDAINAYLSVRENFRQDAGPCLAAGTTCGHVGDAKNDCATCCSNSMYQVNNDMRCGLSNDDKKLLGMTIGVFLVVLIIALIVWVWALVVLIKYWPLLPQVGRVFGILCLVLPVPFGPVFTILISYLARK